MFFVPVGNKKIIRICPSPPPSQDFTHAHTQRTDQLTPSKETYLYIFGAIHGAAVRPTFKRDERRGHGESERHSGGRSVLLTEVICGGKVSMWEKKEHYTQFDRGREPSGDMYFCIERFTVLHSSFFLFWIQTKASSYIKLIWVDRQTK